MPKKGKKKQVTIDEDEQWAGDSDNNDTEEVMSLASLGKKKKKKGKKGKQQQEPAAAMDKIDDDWDLPPDMESSGGKKKKKNKKKKKGQAFDDEQFDEAELAKLEAEIAALEAGAAGGGGGKKNKKKNKKKKKGQAFDDEQFDEAELAKVEAEIAALEAAAAGGGGKKNNKKNKKNKNKAQESFEEIPADDNDDISNEPPATGGGKKNKKNKKKKKNKAFDDEPQEQEDDWNDDADSFDAPAQGGKKGKKGKKNKKGKKGKSNNNDDWDDEEEDQAPPSPPPQQKQGKKNKKAKNKQKQMEKKKKERQQALLEHYRETINGLDAKYDKFFAEDSEAYELFFASFQELAEWYNENLDQVYDDDVFASKIEEMDEAWEVVLGSIEEQWEEANQQTEEERRAKERADRIAELEASGMKVGRGGGSSISAKEKKKREDKMRLKKMKARLEQLDKEQKEKEMKEEQERQEKELAEKRKAEAAQKAEQERLAAEQRAKEEAAWDTESDSDDWGNSRPKVTNNGYGGDSFGPDEIKKKNKNNNNNNKNQGGKGKNQNQNRNKNNKNNKNKQQQQQQAQKKKDDWDDSDSGPEIASKKRRRKNKNKNKNNKNNNNNNNNNNNKNANKNKQNQNKNKNKSNENSKTGSPDSKEKDQKSAEPDEVKVPDEKKEDPNAPISMKVTQGKDTKKGKKKLRSPICVVMGHVDTGKTLILDKIRHSSVQHGEAGGITQQIGATYLTIDYIKKECARMNEQFGKTKFKVPGLLFIDTPGHESFTNLRQRGSSMCDIAILVVDITGGIENQTAESLKMLKEGGVPFIVALNKVDRCLDWAEEKNAPFQTTFKKQKKQTVRDFEHRLGQVKLDFANHGYNTELYYKNKNMEKDISLVPTSAVTGEGIPDLMYLLTRLTQKYMQNKLAKTKFKCNVLEVKTVQGYGATIDVILSGGTLEADDTIIVCGMNDAIVTKVKALLLPHEAQEMRVKGDYMRVEEVVASAGVRIAGHDSLDTAVAGSQLFILDRKYRDPRKFRRERNAEIERLCNKVQSTFNNLKNLISKTGRGVYVQASTLGALEALVTFLQSVKVPICGINIGNVHKSDVMKASIQKQYQKEYCLILAFNVRVVPDAQEMAEQMEVQIFQEEIIYQLHERFTEYITDIRESKKNQAKDVAVFPVEMQILSPEHVFNNKNPIVIGVEIIRGMLRINTPIVVKLYKSLSGSRVIGEPLFLGRITSIQQDHKDKPHAKQGDKVAVRIEGDDSVKNVQVGRSFGLDEKLVSRITRSSIDALKVHFKDELTNDDINHLGQLKKYFEII